MKKVASDNNRLPEPATGSSNVNRYSRSRVFFLLTHETRAVRSDVANPSSLSSLVGTSTCERQAE